MPDKIADWCRLHYKIAPEGPAQTVRLILESLACAHAAHAQGPQGGGGGAREGGGAGGRGGGGGTFRFFPYLCVQSRATEASQSNNHPCNETEDFAPCERHKI